jgi:hypothetical protein
VTLRSGVFAGTGFLADAEVAVPALDAKDIPDGVTVAPGQVVDKGGKASAGRLFVVEVPIPMGNLIKAIAPINDTATWPPRSIETFDVQLTRRIHTRVAPIRRASCLRRGASPNVLGSDTPVKFLSWRNLRRWRTPPQDGRWGCRPRNPPETSNGLVKT